MKPRYSWNGRRCGSRDSMAPVRPRPRGGELPGGDSAGEVMRSVSLEGPSGVVCLVQLGEDLHGEAGVADVLAELLDGGKAVVGDLLLADAQEGGHVAVGPAAHPQQLQHL